MLACTYHKPLVSMKNDEESEENVLADVLQRLQVNHSELHEPGTVEGVSLLQQDPEEEEEEENKQTNKPK